MKDAGLAPVPSLTRDELTRRYLGHRFAYRLLKLVMFELGPEGAVKSGKVLHALVSAQATVGAQVQHLLQPAAKIPDSATNSRRVFMEFLERCKRVGRPACNAV